MMQEDKVSRLTRLKELLDDGILSEEEFAKEKAKVLSDSFQPQQASGIEQEDKPQAMSVVGGPANVDLTSGIVLPLGILAILLSIVSAIFTGMADTGYFDDSGTYTYQLISGICDFLACAAELIMWVCAFNKLSTKPEGNRLGRIPLWTYLYLGAALLMGIVDIADPMSESPLLLIFLLAALAFGYMAFISMYKAYTGKMRTYSIVWMIGIGVSFIMAIVGADLISTIIDAAIYVFLMIALLEKKEV